MKYRICQIIFLFSALCFVAMTPSAALAKDSAIIILDGSGSMWGQIEQKSKIEIARDVMDSLVSDWNQDIDLGLMVYGHREKGSCDDIEMVIPVTAPDTQKIIQAVNNVSPKGTTPISASLSQAAEKLHFSEDPATVILISDGEESCDRDPCAVARDLEARGVYFTAHVIGFDIQDNQNAKDQLKCVAEETGGQFFEAENASGLKQAMAATARSVAKPAPVEKTGPTGIQLSAVPAEGANAFTERAEVTFTIYSTQTDLNGKRKRIATRYDAVSLFPLEAGEYLAEASRGNAIARSQLIVKAGEVTQHRFNLDTGNLMLSAIPAENAEPFSSRGDVTFRVYPAAKGLDGKRKPITTMVEPQSVFKLAAGDYIAEASRGNVVLETTLSVTGGVQIEHVFNLETGNLLLSAVPAEGAAPFETLGEIVFRVYEAKKNLNGKRKLVKTLHDPESMFQLAAADYVATAQRGNALVEAQITVQSGELAEHVFNLNAGNLLLTAAPAEGAAIYSTRGEIIFNVYSATKDLNGRHKRLASNFEPESLFKLAAGDYLAEARLGDKSTQMQVKVNPGEQTEATLIVAQ